MILKIDTLKDACSKILNAVDSNELSILTETLELKTSQNYLYMNVTNREYYVRVILATDYPDNFHATVNAERFLKLISQTTTDQAELTIDGNSMIVKANGIYKFPLIFDNDKLLELPEITIQNKTVNMDIHSDILNSILQFNSKELTRGTISKPVQKLYYVDEKGAITFTSGACVNTFDLSSPVRMLLNNRLVKLFKLFDNEQVNFSLGFDSISGDIIQTKVKFATKNVEITSVLSCDDTLINSVPVDAIRGRALKTYPYSIVVSKTSLLQTVNRLVLFNCDTSNKTILKPYSCFEFKGDTLTVWDVNKQNFETLSIQNAADCNYSATLDLMDLKAVLESCNEEYVTLNFGDSKAFVLSRAKIYNVIPEVRLV